jgi:hypothetical protein
MELLNAPLVYLPVRCPSRPSFAVAGEPLTPRPLDPIVAEAFASAQAQSALVRSLVATLESSNRHRPHSVVTGPAPGHWRQTSFVTSRGGYRYVRITIAVDLSKSGTDGDPRSRIAARLRDRRIGSR